MIDLSAGIPALHEAYAAGATPEAVVEHALKRIEDIGDPGIFIHVADRAGLIAAARALGPFDPSRPLWGIPFAVKDNIDVAGMPTTAACREYAYTPDKDAFAVARLKAAGALVIGKTNLDQFATGLVGVRTPYPVPKNAIDPAIVPGGSSSGSAVAVAQGIVAFALGTDTAGSGRVPAALNDLVGLKPTVGALSASGVVPACRTLDCISIFAQTVADAWVAFAHAAGFDETDAYSRDLPIGHPSGMTEGLKIGAPKPDQLKFFGDDVQAASYRAALDDLAARGAEIVEIDFAPFYETAALLYEGAWVAERYAAIREIMETQPEILHPTTRKIVSGAEGLSAVDAFQGLYRLKDLQRVVAPVLDSVDCLCVPTIPRFVTLEEIADDPITPNSELGTYTNFVNLLDLSAIAVPVAKRTDGRPGNVTLIGKAGADAFLAGVAASIEQGRPAHQAVTMTAPAATPASGEIVLAVVGAHLRGMPLNGELTSRAARFVEETQTSPDYRLYALAGTGVPKPGLVRGGSGSGGAIVVELWSLTPSAFGSFVADIPQPMAIGTLQLSDGRRVKGFVVEPAAVEGALDITELGGWRAYMAQAVAAK